jgi:hypothetical protein
MNFEDILKQELVINEMADITKDAKAKPEEELKAAEELAELIKGGDLKGAVTYYKKKSGKEFPKAVPGILSKKGLITSADVTDFRNALKGSLESSAKVASILNPKRAGEIAAKSKVKAMGPGAAKSDNKDYGVITLDKITKTVGLLYDKYKQDLKLLDPKFNGSVLNMTGAAKMAKDIDAKSRREEFIEKHGKTLKAIKDIKNSKGKFKALSDDEFGKLPAVDKKKYMETKRQSDKLVEWEAQINKQYAKPKIDRNTNPRPKVQEFVKKTADREAEAHSFRDMIKKYDKAEDISKIDMMKIKATLKNMVDNTPTAKQYDADLKAVIKAINNDVKMKNRPPMDDHEKKQKIKKLTLEVKRNKDMIVSQIEPWKDAIARATAVIEKAGTSNELDTDDVEDIMDVLSGKKFESTQEPKGRNTLLEEIIGHSGINK